MKTNIVSANIDFAKNLYLLCSYYKSIAEVCRKLSFNRAQFNRYLNGQTKPNANTMLRICEFFGVEDFEMMMPHSQFKLLIQVRPKSQTPPPQLSLEKEHLTELERASTHELEKFLGYYFEYHMSMSKPGMILRMLVCFDKKDGKIYYQRTERIVEESNNKIHHGVYLGIPHFLVDRLFMVDYESLTKHEVSQTILFITYKNRISQLKGLKIGVSGSGQRLPICTRVIYKYLGASVNVRKALALCGLYEMSSNKIEKSIKDAIKNDISDDEVHFRARY
jgi:transcriptional regulator with XRE-family HTH domain